MSRIGKQPITIPDGVTVSIEEDVERVRVTGKRGELFVPLPSEIAVVAEGSILTLSRKKENARTSALWGLTRSLIFNAVEGVTEGYTKTLIIEGIGYKVQLQGDTLVLSLGFSHDITLKAPEGITFEVDKMTITISGFDKQLVGNTAAKIRSYKKPEPYKGKGIRYDGEVIKRKAGKKAIAAA